MILLCRLALMVGGGEIIASTTRLVSEGNMMYIVGVPFGTALVFAGAYLHMLMRKDNQEVDDDE